MSRQLDINTLDAAGRDYAAMFAADRAPFDRAYVRKNVYQFTFMDEFEYVTDAMAENLGPKPLVDFKAMMEELRAAEPRKTEVFHKLLADKLAIDPDGEHIPGKIGTTNIGARVVGKRIKTLNTSKGMRDFVKNVYWPLYAGEGHERAADSGVADELPEGAEPLPVGALNTRIANVIAIKACDAIVDELDTGTVDGVIEGRSGAQPADPDTAVTGTLLFSLDLATPAFGAAIDGAPGGEATAGAIADDISADATATLGYCRASSANVALTPLDDLIDGEAGTSGADFNFNTLAIVAGATVSMTSWVVTMPEA